jgi:dephospho-CoA kinase
LLRVGLTGGLASGKSFVANHLAELGCHVIRADDLGHAVIAPGGEAWGPVVAAFGNGILKESGEIDRRRLGDLVFGKPDRLAALNAIMHPPIFRRQERLIAAAEAADPHGIAVVEAAIMFETGSHLRYQKIIVATCTGEQQIERAMKRDHLTREQVMERLARQIPLAEKVKRADYVIDTSGTKEQTLRQTERVYESLRSIALP